MLDTRKITGFSKSIKNAVMEDVVRETREPPGTTRVKSG